MNKSASKMTTYFSHGKLMLTGEYLVLSGAKSLALATLTGQYLTATSNEENNILWISFDQDDEVWFSATFDIKTLEITGTVDDKRAHFIQSLFIAVKELNPRCFYGLDGVEFNTHLEFDEDWGLGSSSTLINNLALWAKVDAYALLAKTLQGSGYDIAVARAGGEHIMYSLKPIRVTRKIEFDPSFKKNLFFVYLNRKQSSATEVAKFVTEERELKDEVLEISEISKKISEVERLEDFEVLIKEHNTIMSKVLNRQSAQDVFSDYKGGVTKYLGAWGGDFMLVTGEKKDLKFFEEKGYNTIIAYSELIK